MSIVYIDRLKDGQEEFVEEELNPAFLELENDPDLSPKGNVHVYGKVYVAGDWLIVQASLEANFVVRCALCNEPFEYVVRIPDWMHEESLENIKGCVFDYAKQVREALLLEVPYYLLCGGQKCLHIEEVAPYLSRTRGSKQREKRQRGKAVRESTEEVYKKEQEENGHQPFKDFFLEKE